LITEHRENFGVVPICRALTLLGVPIAPRTYYAHLARAPSKRALWEVTVTELLAGIYEPDQHGRRRPESLYGSVKTWAYLQRLGISVPSPRHAADPTAWLMRYRRLVRCYERRPAHHEAMLLWATVHLMTRRLARELAGLPPAARWDAPPPLPELTSPDRRGKILELLAAQPWRAWRGVELAAVLGITNINSFRVQLSQWAHQGHINKIGPALYAPACTS
jgi:hypothetical protein